MSLDVQALTKTMIDAVRAAVSGRWPALRALAEVELHKLAQSMLDVYALVQSGDISQSHARRLMRMHQNAARGVFCTVKGYGVLTAERATNAAIRAVANTVNTVLQFRLLEGGKEVTAEFKAGKDL